jgi:hypothetical protein
MLKRKRDVVTPEMRNRLLANRDGKLTPDQWLSIVTKPLLWTLMLLGLAVVVFGPRMLLLTARFWWLGLILLVALILVPLMLRARRYARLPLQFARLYADVPFRPWWRPMVFYTEADEPVAFKRRLAPSINLRIDSEYLVYYLQDGGERVLLSLAPSDHEDAEKFLPTEQFKLRFSRRTQS